MAVAHDAVSESDTGTTGVASVASFTWNHVPTGSPRSALVFTLALGANPVTSVTYGGVSMTAVPYTAYDSDTEPGFLQAWFLDNCGTGTKAVVVNRTNNAVVTYAVCMTQTAASACEVYTAGVKTIAAAGTEQTAASSSGTGVSSSWSSMTLTDGSPGTNSVRYLAVYSGASSVPTAGANTSSLSTPGYIDFGVKVFQSFVETAPSQGAKALNVGVAISDDLAVIGLAVREAVAGNVTATPGTAALTITPQTPTVTASDHKTVTPGTVALSLTAQTPVVTASDHQTATPGTASLALTAQTPTVAVSDNRLVTPGTLALVASPQAPTVTTTAHQTVTPGTVALTLSPFAPVVTGGAGTTVTPGTASLSLSPLAPSVTATSHQSVTPGTATLTLTAFAPVVTAGAGLTVVPGTAALSMTAFAPDVVLSDHQLVTPGTASLVLAPQTPTVTASGGVITGGAPPGIGSSSALGRAPSGAAVHLAPKG